MTKPQQKQASHAIALAKAGRFMTPLVIHSDIACARCHPQLSRMQGFSYVYMLESEREPGRHYVGFTDDLETRLATHNRGGVPATRPLRPWLIKTAVAFREGRRARAFERYLKSGSGRAFALRHF